MPKHVLVVDDDASLCVVVAEALQKSEYRVTVAPSPDEVAALLEADDVDVVLTDVKMQGTCGIDLCARIVASGRDVPVVVMTAFGNLESAVGAIRAGAFDYVTKPLDMAELTIALDRAAAERSLREEARRLRAEVARPPFAAPDASFEGMVGTSPGMEKIFALIERVAATEAAVLVTGESGSGKELVARAIHARSTRAQGPFVAINCAAMPESLLESELFGHTKGAFTDAHQARQGLFSKAEGGTLFLDEIGEMPLGMQAKLLRALQERTVRPVGGDAEVPFDARILTATNLELEEEVAQKRFREDLFFRINVVHIPVLPLRQRGCDVLRLAGHMLRAFQPSERKVVGLTSAVIRVFLSYAWPGNIRELQNCIQRALAIAEFDHVTLEDLPETMRVPQHAASVEVPGSELITIEELQRRYCDEVLKATGNNKTVAARILGIDRRTLYRKLEAFARRAAPRREQPTGQARAVQPAA
jgi:two-component system response regulator HydG